MKTKVAIVGIVGLPPKYGGFETLADNLVKQLSSEVDFRVFCSSVDVAEKNDKYLGAKLIYVGLKANGISSILYDIISMIKAVRCSEVILVLGVSGAVIFPFLKLFAPKVRIIVNPDGLEWKRDKWNKPTKKFLKFCERIAVRYSDVIVGDNKVIADYLNSEYGAASTVIAYGGDHVDLDGSEIESNPVIFKNKRYGVNVSRIVPENNAHLILEGFANSSTWDLVFIGNWDDSEYSKKLYNEYCNRENIHLFGPMFDAPIEKNYLRKNADLYVHGHSAGGTSPALVEAMCLGLPVITYNVSYNKETTEGQALFYDSSDDISRQVDSLDSQKLLMLGETMKGIATRRYTWNVVSKQYAEILR